MDTRLRHQVPDVFKVLARLLSIGERTEFFVALAGREGKRVSQTDLFV